MSITYEVNFCRVCTMHDRLSATQEGDSGLVLQEDMKFVNTSHPQGQSIFYTPLLAVVAPKGEIW